MLAAKLGAKENISKILGVVKIELAVFSRQGLAGMEFCQKLQKQKYFLEFLS